MYVITSFFKLASRIQTLVLSTVINFIRPVIIYVLQIRSVASPRRTGRMAPPMGLKLEVGNIFPAGPEIENLIGKINFYLH